MLYSTLFRTIAAEQDLDVETSTFCAAGHLRMHALACAQDAAAVAAAVAKKARNSTRRNENVHSKAVRHPTDDFHEGNRLQLRRWLR